MAAALKVAPEVPSALINLAGRQRMLLQKMTKEAVIESVFLSMGPTEQAPRNKKLVNEAVGAFVETRDSLLQGQRDNAASTVLSAIICLLHSVI